MTFENYRFLSFIGRSYRAVLKPLLFLFPPERMHQLFGRIGWQSSKVPFLVSLLRNRFQVPKQQLAQTLHGLNYINPVGIAAGFDKDANLLNLYSALGCGHAEIGSVTMHPYAGNSSPRLIRLPKEEGIFVNYGLKNYGIDRLTRRLQKRTDTDYVLSVSVARTNCKETAYSLEHAIQDYLWTIRKLATIPDKRNALTLNISCPNARSGEQFATPENLQILLEEIAASELVQQPVFLKMPLLDSLGQAYRLAEVAQEFPLVKGLIVSNLLKDKSSFTQYVLPRTSWGISGKPTQQGSDMLLSEIYQRYGSRFTLIGVGGVFSADDAYRKICLGASLVQLATGLIYRGPQLISEINRGLVELLRYDGYTHISEAVGSLVG